MLGLAIQREKGELTMTTMPRSTQHLTLEQVRFVADMCGSHIDILGGNFPKVINIETHLHRDGVFVVLGMEDPSHGPACYFTRRATKRVPSSRWGSYGMTLEEAYADFQERRES